MATLQETLAFLMVEIHDPIKQQTVQGVSMFKDTLGQI